VVAITAVGRVLDVVRNTVGDAVGRVGALGRAIRAIGGGC
jgi:hypothetical protein